MGQEFGQGIAESLGMAANKNVLAIQRLTEQIKNNANPDRVRELGMDVIKNT